MSITSEGDLWHGRKIGKWMDYHYDGSPKYENEREEEYVLRSVEEGQTGCWGREGRLRFQEMESKGKRVGILTDWNHGVKVYEHNWDERTETHWHDYGAKKSFETNIYGASGIIQEWYENGKLISEREDKEGDMVYNVYRYRLQ